MAKQTATSLDHAAACKQTFTDWETRLANILSQVEGEDSTSRVGDRASSADPQHNASVDSATAEWQVCKINRIHFPSCIVLAWFEFASPQGRSRDEDAWGLSSALSVLTSGKRWTSINAFREAALWWHTLAPNLWPAPCWRRTVTCTAAWVQSTAGGIHSRHWQRVRSVLGGSARPLRSGDLNPLLGDRHGPRSCEQPSATELLKEQPSLPSNLRVCLRFPPLFLQPCHNPLLQCPCPTRWSFRVGTTSRASWFCPWFGLARPWGRAGPQPVGGMAWGRNNGRRQGWSHSRIILTWCYWDEATGLSLTLHPHF